MKKSRLERQFDEFHADNPVVYDLIVRFARQAKAAGFNRYSINGIFERVRWHVDIETKSMDGFKINNNHRSRYARMVMENESGLDEFFDIRELKS